MAMRASAHAAREGKGGLTACQAVGVMVWGGGWLGWGRWMSWFLGGGDGGGFVGGWEMGGRKLRRRSFIEEDLSKEDFKSKRIDTGQKLLLIIELIVGKVYTHHSAPRYLNKAIIRIHLSGLRSSFAVLQLEERESKEIVDVCTEIWLRNIHSSQKYHSRTLGS